ncbi:PTS sugar transporter subunit IIA [Beijerinckia sp. L45]|uniref:PTS sugar transporter subunit IIA n=1 Tax=Beijerinckia sp. L45 TaxID=1641855 RepID=UPI00131DC30D|nr:PTS sugar transporter subunit IIA [Beijerinckia sp. L45]
MDLSTLLQPTQCLVDQRFSSKTQCLNELAKRAAVALAIEPGPISEALHHRESLGSTGLGNGIALPHARLTTISQPFCLLARLSSPLAFDAVDEKPVDLVCLVLLPAAPSCEQLNVLAGIARRLRDGPTLTAMRKSKEPKTLFAAAAGMRA